ncbi:hypothetical protein C9374_009566 [Naegleria lovaniensis]|uniref:Glycoside hydrolase family 15 protein n=1 Tax=Naegleria lovaniensis TaxID=51637 RepID=A0AA88H3I2_NAELO|nr:uncharacterized protein C9374_009566 [Naegleria lovaniensis]KAG2392989.1 hypothetical protein C9374_009566 [Naegleria lovaniensis]
MAQSNNKDNYRVDYLPIDSHGMIGNMTTCALVGIEGTIDWFCYPQFNSESIFGRILDCQKGGSFAIRALNYTKSQQHYWPDTNILITRFMSKSGIGELTDFMPFSDKKKFANLLIRKVTCVHGKMTFRLSCCPAFNYARDTHQCKLEQDKKSALFSSPQLNVMLKCGGNVELKVIPVSSSSSSLYNTNPYIDSITGDVVESEFSIEEDEEVTFMVGSEEDLSLITSEDMNELSNDWMNETLDYWHNWLKKCTYKGRWRETVRRSALALKLLVFEKTGAILAAPSTSLPEGLGGVRNWDYRYTWIRDASFTLYSFMRIGFMEEASRFVQFLASRISEMSQRHKLSDEKGAPPPLQVMYSIDGEHELDEMTLDHLSGYMNSKPVRIGNGAYNQLQLDIYGELMDSMYIYNKYGTPISYDFWQHLRFITNWVCNNWDEKDEGIWEVRGGRQNFVYSRVMSWVCLDRALKIAQSRSFPADTERWIQVRNEIFEQVIEKGYNNELQSFTSFYGSDTLDASTLIIPLVSFLSPADTLVVSTLKAINRPPEENGLVSSSLVYRYIVEKTDDGFAGGEEGTFNLCTFWLIEAISRACRHGESQYLLQEARMMFEQMLTYGNHLSLYSEEMSFHGEALGNFPQAFTFISLISAAFNLDATLNIVQKNLA